MLAEDEGRSDAVELADLFARQARLRIDQLFAGLWHNEDSRNYKADQRMLEGRYSWLEEGLVGAWDMTAAPDSETLPRAV